MKTTADLASALATQLDARKTATEISDWAHSVYLDSGPTLEPAVVDALMQLIAINEGPEFEFTEPELRALVQELIDHSVSREAP
jgi:hypothetical protein